MRRIPTDALIPRPRSPEQADAPQRRPDLLCEDEAAAHLRVSISELRAAVACGVVGRVRFGEVDRFLRSYLDSTTRERVVALRTVCD